MRGILFFLFQTVFNLYTWFFGRTYLGKLVTLGTVETAKKGRVTVYGDNSFLILLYGILTLFVVLFFVIVYFNSIRDGARLEKYKKMGIKPDSFVRDLGRLSDDRFHITLLSLPMVGLFMFTIVPLVTMIFIAFTNYDANHEVPEHLFQWVGFQNFRDLGKIGFDLLDRVGRDQVAAVVDAVDVFDHIDGLSIKSGALQTDFVDHFHAAVTTFRHHKGRNVL
jgi:arabinogalactan oligomer/maltooligosaccharide transport system permease protein